MIELCGDVRMERATFIAAWTRQPADPHYLSVETDFSLRFAVGEVAIMDHMVWFEDPSWGTNEHGLVEVHAFVELLPVQCDDLGAVAPEFERVHVAGGDAKTVWVDSVQMPSCIVDQMVERVGEERGDGGFGDIDEEVAGVGQF